MARAVLLLLALLVALASSQPFSAPSLPLATRSPYFSVWTFARTLPGQVAKHWSFDPDNGFLARTISMVRVAGKAFNVLADGAGAQIPDARQTSASVGATRTDVGMDASGGDASANVSVRASFVTPLLPDDIQALSDPTVYVTLEATNHGSQAVPVEFLFGLSGELLVSRSSTGTGVRPPVTGARRSNCTDRDADVTWGQYHDLVAASGAGLSASRLGRVRQETLCNMGDKVKANWGWQYLVPAPSGGAAYTVCAGCGLKRGAQLFVDSGTVPAGPQPGPPRPVDDPLRSEPAVLAAADLGSLGPGQTASARFVWAVDEVLSIDFYGQPLPPLWRRGLPLNDTEVVPRAMLERAVDRFDELDGRTRAFDAALLANNTAVGGPALGFLAALSYRQAMGAGALVWNAERNETWSFVKEQSTNGDLSTQDIIWPQMPVLALYAPWMLRQQLLPHFELCANRTWQRLSNAWTSHQLGTWPVAYSGDDQEFMPVETTADIAEAMALVEERVPGSMASAITAGAFWPTVWQWVRYLLTQAPGVPTSQKYTNDFRGEEPGWTNLAAKAAVGLGAYASLLRKQPAGARAAGSPDPAVVAAAAANTSEYFSQRAWAGDHFVTCFDCPRYDAPSTFDYKYNLMGLVAMPEEAAAPLRFDRGRLAQELAFYMERRLPFGLPFASDDNVTGVPTWEMMYAVSTMNRTTGAASSEALWMWEAGARAYSDPRAPQVPMSDMFDAVTLANKGTNDPAKRLGMRARPTVGTVFLPLYVSLRARGLLWQAEMPPLPPADSR